MIVVEAERDGRLAHAGAAEEIATSLDLIRNDMADWKLAAHRGIPIPEDSIDALRTRLGNVVEWVLRLGNESAASCEALASFLPRTLLPVVDGEPHAVDPNGDTLDMAIEELAEINALDAKD